ncbi:MAG: hypothetical protein AB7D05_04430 [Mangrovibacterium sp.]
MKKLLFILSFGLLLTGHAGAQQDSIRWKPAGTGKSRISLFKGGQVLGTRYWENKFKGNWTGFFIGLCGPARTDYSDYPENSGEFMKTEPLRSYCFSLNLLQIPISLQRSRNTIGLVTGAGLNIWSWRLNNNRLSLIKGAHRLEPMNLSYDHIRKSKLVSAYLTIPFLAEFQIPLRQYGNRLYLSGGLIGSIRLSTYTRVNYTHNNKDYKEKSPGDYYLRDYRISATVRAGYRWINLFATYDLQPAFENGKGPEARIWSAGIALIMF